MFRTMKPARENYIPEGARKVAMKNGGAVFYLYDRGSKFYAVCFVGKSQKPSWHFWYSSAAKREAKIVASIAGVQANIDYKASIKAERKADAEKGHGWGVGLILTGSWGYEQTNVDFFEIVKVIGKNMIEIEQIGSQPATDSADGLSSMADQVVPDPESRSGKISRHIVRRGSIKSPVYGNASLWDGRPRYHSWYH